MTRVIANTLIQLFNIYFDLSKCHKVVLLIIFFDKTCSFFPWRYGFMLAMG